MTEVTRILKSIEDGNPKSAEELLPLVYEELRKLAAIRMSQEKSGQTLQATALVHDAYIRLVDVEASQHWDSRGHFFGAAAEAMRRILIDRARAGARQKRGGDHRRLDIDAIDISINATPDQLVSISEALDRLEREAPEASKIVKLRYFAGLNVQQAATALGISSATAYRHWNYARAWLHAELIGPDGS